MKSKLHSWIHKNKLDKQWLHNVSGFPAYQVKKLLNDPLYKPDGTTMRIVLSNVKKKDDSAKLSDFWDV
ncbi:hypothetical protein AWM68_07440 [Fictibacillus phosphorivorans]|uniref:Uncharacterized protein n=1 Tax=Fictibacillus phosphorivorans TaxID=1221500 RepID=A0A163R4W7_9BACL|nr:hypothetical protein [Fictibacillus phosphorivorans]KZE66195.1 hypothetical protein AWM68_07440 [Fictibacillus phosphorivorans]